MMPAGIQQKEIVKVFKNTLEQRVKVEQGPAEIIPVLRRLDEMVRTMGEDARAPIDPLWTTQQLLSYLWEVGQDIVKNLTVSKAVQRVVARVRDEVAQMAIPALLPDDNIPFGDPESVSLKNRRREVASIASSVLSLIAGENPDVVTFPWIKEQDEALYTRMREFFFLEGMENFQIMLHLFPRSVRDLCIFGYGTNLFEESDGPTTINVTRILPNSADENMDDAVKLPETGDHVPEESEPTLREPNEGPDEEDELPLPEALSEEAYEIMDQGEVPQSSRFVIELQIKVKIQVCLSQEPELLSRLLGVEPAEMIQSIPGLKDYVLDELNAASSPEAKISERELAEITAECVRNHLEKATQQSSHAKKLGTFSVLKAVMTLDEQAEADLNLEWLRTFQNEKADSAEKNDRYTSFVLALADYFSPKAEQKFYLPSLLMMSRGITHLRMIGKTSQGEKKKRIVRGKISPQEKNGEEKGQYVDLIGDFLRTLTVSQVEDPSDPLCVSEARQKSAIALLRVQHHETADRLLLLRNSLPRATSDEERKRIEGEIASLSIHFETLEKKRAKAIASLNASADDVLS